MAEKDLYPIVEKWMEKYFRCFKTGREVSTALKLSRADVVGVRDTGGEHSGEVELIVVEVKNGNQPFATASGQALGYSVYANRVYLADNRENGFSPDELDIASNLGVGLIQIRNKDCQEVLSSRRHQPLTRMWLDMIRCLGLGQCRICGTFVDLGVNYSNFKKEKVRTAIEQEKGLVYWHAALAARKKEVGIARTSEHENDSYQRRFVCNECVQMLLAPLRPIAS